MLPQEEREFNRLLELMCTSLCSSPLFVLSTHTAAQINHNYSTCSTEMPASVKKAICLFVCMSVSVVVCLFFTGAQGKGKENGWLSAVNHKWVEESVAALEGLSVIAPATCHISVSSLFSDGKKKSFLFSPSNSTESWSVKRSHFVGLIA